MLWDFFYSIVVEFFFLMCFLNVCVENLLKGCEIGVDILEEVVKREKEVGICFELDVDIFMKVVVLLSSNGSFVVEYVLNVGFFICFKYNVVLFFLLRLCVEENC